MGLQTLSASDPPVTLEEAKAHLRIDGTADDATLAAIIAAATQYVEQQTRQALTSTTFRLSLDTFPQDREIQLPRPPLQSVEAIKYTDATSQEQTLDPATYTVDTATKPGRIVLKPGQTWPSTDGSAASVRVEFTAGYGTGDDVPMLLRQAIKLTAGAWMELREGATDRRYDSLPVPFAVESIVAMFAFPEVIP